MEHPATQGVCARPKASAHTGYGITYSEEFDIQVMLAES